MRCSLQWLHQCMWIACECKIHTEIDSLNIFRRAHFLSNAVNRNTVYQFRLPFILSFSVECTRAFGRRRNPCRCWFRHSCAPSRYHRERCVRMKIFSSEWCWVQNFTDRCVSHLTFGEFQYRLCSSSDRNQARITTATRNNSFVGSHRCIDLWQFAHIVQVSAVDLTRHCLFYGFSDYNCCVVVDIA